MDMQLKGLRALVTGGTKGIGRAIAETLAKEGASVAFCARNAAEVADAAKAMSASGSKVIGSVADVGNADSLKAWVAKSAADLGGIDIVVANVSALAIAADEESWKKGFEVDLMGSVRLVDSAMPFLEKSKHPAIVTISSVSGREIDFASGPYGAFKAALVHYTQGLAYHLAGKGIRANSVSPGNTYFPGGVWSQIESGNPDFFKVALGMNPTGRMGTPQEMANAVVFLASTIEVSTYPQWFSRVYSFKVLSPRYPSKSFNFDRLRTLRLAFRLMASYKSQRATWIGLGPATLVIYALGKYRASTPQPVRLVTPCFYEFRGRAFQSEVLKHLTSNT